MRAAARQLTHAAPRSSSRHIRLLHTRLQQDDTAPPASPAARMLCGGLWTGLHHMAAWQQQQQPVFGATFVASTRARVASDAQIELATKQEGACGGALLSSGRVSSISWPGAGSLLAWQLGALAGLQQGLGAEALRRLHFIGSSSGALLSVVAACPQLDPVNVLDAACTLSESARHLQQQQQQPPSWWWRPPWRRLGPPGALPGQRLLAEWLAQLLPDDAAAACRGRITLLATSFPWLSHVHLTRFGSKAQLVAALLGSAHIPLWLDGRWAAELAAELPAVAMTSAPAAAAAAAAAAVAACRPLRAPQPARVIDGNFWLSLRGCYRGFAPLDGSTALVVEPQQDELLPALLPGVERRFSGLQLLGQRQAAALYESGVRHAQQQLLAPAGQLLLIRRRRPAGAASTA